MFLFISKFKKFCFVWSLYENFRITFPFFPFTIAVFYRSKHCRHRHSLQISWIGICTYSAIKYHHPNVPGCVASLPSLPCSSCHLYVVSGKNKSCFKILFCILTASLRYKLYMFRNKTCQSITLHVILNEKSIHVLSTILLEIFAARIIFFWSLKNFMFLTMVHH